MRPLIQLDELRRVLRYDPETGVFTWLVAPPRKPNFVGRQAGATDGKGYWLIKLRQRIYRANRLAWYHYYGVWPELEIDHWNGIRDDNSIRNLREATRVEQLHNLHGARKHNKSGMLGVSHQSKNSWSAEINIGGKRVRLGSFSSPEAASEAYKAAKRIHHPFSNRPHDPDWLAGEVCDPAQIPF